MPAGRNPAGYQRPEWQLFKGSDGILRCSCCNDGLHQFCEKGDCKCLCSNPTRAPELPKGERVQGVLGDFLDGDVTRE